MESNFPTQPPIRAWRCFVIRTPHYFERLQPHLVSPVQLGTILFPNQVYKAECRKHPSSHSAPQLDCDCGWYAFKKRRDARNYLRRSIMAEVLLGGRIIETEFGYRAEQMIITKIYCNKEVRNVETEYL